MAVEVVAEEEITGAIIAVRRLIGVDTVAIKKYIVNLPDHIEKEQKDYPLLYNDIPMDPIPYEETVDVYKETLELLKVADKYALEKIYGVNSLEELFNSVTVSDIVGKYKAESNKYYRILELLKDIDIFELRSIVNDLYDAKCDEMRRLIEIMKTLKGENKSESD